MGSCPDTDIDPSFLLLHLSKLSWLLSMRLSSNFTDMADWWEFVDVVFRQMILYENDQQNGSGFFQFNVCQKL